MRHYFDNAATSWPKAPGVAKAMSGHIADELASPTRTFGGPGEAVLDLGEDIRARLLSLYGMEDGVCVFNSGLTESLNTIIRGLARPGDRILVTPFEHNSVLRPLVMAGASIELIELRGWRVDASSITAKWAKATRRPDMAFITAASNVTGAFTDLENVAAALRACGIPFVIDSAQASPLMEIKADKLGAEAVCFTAHKGFLGPEGVGGMVMTRKLAEKIPPLISGGTGSESDNLHMPSLLPDKFEAGTRNTTALAGFRAALDWLDANPDAHRAALARAGEIVRMAKTTPGMNVVGGWDSSDCAPAVSLVHGEMDVAELALRLSQASGIEARVGVHCAPLAMKALGVNGTLRLSPGPFTTDDDMEALKRGLREALKS